MAYKAKREHATELRREGYSYNYISRKTGISKGTLSDWFSNLPYAPNKEILDKISNARIASGLYHNRRKLETIQKAKVQAKIDVGSISNRDLFMLGLGVYIGEGSKSRTIRVVNSNPKIIRLVIKWFRECCGLGMDNFVIRLHLYPDNNIKRSITFWQKETDIPRKQFQKTQIDKRKNKKIAKRGKLPYGTAHLTVKSNGNAEFGIFLTRRISCWMDEVL